MMYVGSRRRCGLYGGQGHLLRRPAIRVYAGTVYSGLQLDRISTGPRVPLFALPHGRCILPLKNLYTRVSMAHKQ